MTCSICQQEFQPKTKTQKYCSKRCATKAVHLGNIKHVPTERLCDHCQQPYTPAIGRGARREGSGGKRFCSNTCKHLGHRTASYGQTHYARYEKNLTPEQKAKYQETKRHYNLSIYGRAHRLYAAARHRAKRRGLSFTITFEWVINKLEQGACEVTKLPFVLTDKRSPWAPSLDRKVPELGYTQENTQMVVFSYNTAKQEYSHENVVTLAHALTQATT